MHDPEVVGSIPSGTSTIMAKCTWWTYVYRLAKLIIPTYNFNFCIVYDRYKPTKDNQLIYVYYSSLNFRDIMLSTGKLTNPELDDYTLDDVIIYFIILQNCQVILENYNKNVHLPKQNPGNFFLAGFRRKPSY